MAEAYGMRHAVAIANGASRQGAIESTSGRPKGWYVRPALGASRTTAVGLVGLLLLAGCGGERGDEDEPSGDFPVEVVKATFPEQQKLAQSSNLVITLRNAGDETIPNLGVGVEGFDYAKDDDPSLADRSRPVFAANGEPVQIGGFPEAKDGSPRGCDSAYVDTWACGPARSGQGEDLPLVGHRGQGGRFRLTLAGLRRPTRQGPGGSGRRGRRATLGLVQRHDLAPCAAGSYRRRRRDGGHGGLSSAPGAKSRAGTT